MKLQTNLRKGDNIIVNSGKFRGKTDIIENINKNFVFLSSLSIIKKFKLKNLKEGDPTEKKIFIPIRISNVSFWSSENKFSSKITNFTLIDKEGKKIKSRIMKKNKILISKKEYPYKKYDTVKEN